MAQVGRRLIHTENTNTRHSESNIVLVRSMVQVSVSFLLSSGGMYKFSLIRSYWSEVACLSLTRKAISDFAASVSFLRCQVGPQAGSNIPGNRYS